MSYILNALRKSEQQRIRSEPETLETSILERNEPQQKKRSLWLIVLIIVNMIFLGFIIFTLVEDDNSEVTQKVDKTRQISEKSVVVVQDSGHVSALDTAKIKKQQQVSIIEKIKKRKPTSKPVKTKVDIIKDKTKPKPRKTIEKPAKLAPVIAKLAKAVEAVKVNEGDKKTTAESIPFLKELPYEFFSKVPEFNINVFAYIKEKNDRFIIVDREKKKIDEQILPGMILQEIRENSIVVEYKGKIFQIKR